MRFWGKLKIEDKIIKDITVKGEDFKGAISVICGEFDLSKPLMLEKHLSEIRQFNRTVFYADDFIESVSFDSLEIEKIVTKKKL
jgi:hypothetical protein